MIVQEVSFSDLKFIHFAQLAMEQWPEYFFEDLLIFSTKLKTIVGILDDKVVAGCFLSKEIVNEPAAVNRELIHSYAEKGYWNLSYFVVDPKKRGVGYGSQFLDKLISTQEFQKLWIECEKNLISFYQYAGFSLLETEDDGHDNYYLFRDNT